MTTLLHIFTSLLIILNDSGTKPSEQILGIWLTAEKDGKVQMYKKDGKYYGKIIWIDETTADSKVDEHNPNPKLRSRPIVGLNIVKALKWDADEQEWNDGEIYDPQSGDTYSVYAKMIDKNHLFIKGYIGFSLLGRSTEWTRVE